MRLHLIHQVCGRQIFTIPIYAAGAPAPAPAPASLACLALALLYLILTALLAWALAGLCTWRLALARSPDQAFRLLSVRLYGPAILAHLAFQAERAFRATYGARLRRCQFAALTVLRFSLSVVRSDMALACIFAFVPFTLGRIILLCRGEVDSFASTSSILLAGYGFIFSLGGTFAALHTSHEYSRGESILFDVFCKRIIKLIIAANAFINLIITAIICPFLFAWLLDTCTSKMFDVTISGRVKLLCASSYVSAAIYWLIGCALLDLGSTFSRLHCTILGPAVTSRIVHHNVNIHEPFYESYLKKLPGLFVGIILIVMFIVVPIQIACPLAPEKFPVDITYFVFPKKGMSSGRALLFAIPQLPLTVGLKSNDLLALVVGFGIISAIIAASRDWSVYMISGRKDLVALNRCVIVFLWFVIVPLLIGLLVDLSLISPFTGPDDGVPVLDLFYTWFLGGYC
ncbi:hypothetical protein ZWY2020_045625 [Hordeum vulgare]|nr:hypothetical protein ZWY2020_045625 [Hordeum vulgare]